MDSLTQAVLGASIGGAVAGKHLGRTALVGGAALGTLPDLDVVIDYGTAIANFTQHRGFSHSLFVLVPLALALGFALHRWKPGVPLGRCLAFTLLILVTHPLLDVLTTYGTQLFWPIGPPLGTTSIFIIDPLYTLPLLLAFLYGLVRPPALKFQTTALALSSLYLVWAVTAQTLVEQRISPELAKQGLADAPTMIQPMPFNTLLWRVTVMGDSERLEMVTGPFEGDRPLVVERFPVNRALLQELASLPEGQRLVWFTDGFLDVRASNNELLATDIRLGVPGAHPFTFVVAEKNNDGWKPVDSSKTSRPTVSREAIQAYWSRLSGEAEVLCLATFKALPGGSSCS